MSRRRRVPGWRGCSKPPRGWWCSRNSGHGGPCAARPTWWKQLWLFVKGYPL